MKYKITIAKEGEMEEVNSRYGLVADDYILFDAKMDSDECITILDSLYKMREHNRSKQATETKSSL